MKRHYACDSCARVVARKTHRLLEFDGRYINV